MPKGAWTRTPTIGEEQGAALRKLVSDMPVIDSGNETPQFKILALKARLQELAQPAPAYSTDFHRFLTERVWTKDEAMGGRVRRFPDYPYLKDLCDDLIIEKKYFLEKSRRVLATWACCAFDVWLAAGGQDPRWPALKWERGNRQVFLCHRKFEDSNKYLRQRVWYIIQELEGRNIRAVWPDFPRWTWKEGEITASNGSLITAVAQGSDQLRGFAATLLHLEELAFWEMGKQSVESAIPTMRGGGHMVAITTASAGSYAKMIRDGRLRLGVV